VTNFPARLMSEAVPSAQTLAAVVSDLENRIARDPRVAFWGRAENYDPVTKVLTDHRWRERRHRERTYGETVLTTNAPTLTADFEGTGLPAMTFAGAEGLVGDWQALRGAFSALAVFSIPSVPSGNKVLFGAADLSNDLRLGHNLLKGHLYTGQGLTTAGNILTGYDAIQLMEWSVSPEADGQAMRVNNGTWDLLAMDAYNDVSASVVPTIGFTSTDTDFPFTGDIPEFFDLTVPIQSAAFTELGDLIRAYLAARYSITLAA